MERLPHRHRLRLDRIPQTLLEQISTRPQRARMKKRPVTMALSLVRNVQPLTRMELRQ